MRKNLLILTLTFLLIIAFIGLILVVAKDKVCEPWHFWAEGCLDKWQTLWAGVLSLIAAFIGALAILWQTRVQIQTTIDSEKREEERTRERLRAAYSDSISELLEDVRGHLLRLESLQEGLEGKWSDAAKMTVDSATRLGFQRSVVKAADLVPTRHERMLLGRSVPTDMFMWITDIQRHLEGSLHLQETLRTASDIGSTLELIKERVARAVEELNYLKKVLSGETATPPA
jgi:hypothetical protein